MQTYWCEPKLNSQSTSSLTDSDGHDTNNEQDKNDRLVDWNVDILARLLQKIVHSRNINSNKSYNMLVNPEISDVCPFTTDLSVRRVVIDEVKEVIEFPALSSTIVDESGSSETVALDESVLNQLRILISSIADLYNTNSFHNFDHASHVTMSIGKLISRMASSKDEENFDPVTEYIHKIASDPLIQFSCVFAGLIHDVAHPGK